jgi:hypothetical protein
MRGARLEPRHLGFRSTAKKMDTSLRHQPIAGRGAIVQHGHN